MNTSEHFGLDRIRELTATIDMPGGVVVTPGVKQYQALNGTILVWNIHWQEEFAINQIFMSENAKLQNHSRGEKEWIITMSGKLLVTVDGKQTSILPQHHLVLEPGVSRDIISECDTYVVSITMPASSDWPH